MPELRLKSFLNSTNWLPIRLKPPASSQWPGSGLVFTGYATVIYASFIRTIGSVTPLLFPTSARAVMFINEPATANPLIHSLERHDGRRLVDGQPVVAELADDFLKLGEVDGFLNIAVDATMVAFHEVALLFG